MTRTRPLIGLSSAFLLAAPLWLWAACGEDGELVGASCRDDRDCDRDARCYQGPDFPQGQCSVACRDSRDCPSDSACIERHSGYCAWTCRDDRDCRDGYKCRSTKERGYDGDVKACRR